MLATVAYGADTPSRNYEGTPTSLATRPLPYSLVVNYTDSNDTALTPDTVYWDSLSVGTVFKKIDAAWNYVEVAFYAAGSPDDANYVSDPNTVSFTFTIWASRWGASAVPVYYGTAVVGNCELSRPPEDTGAANRYNSGSLSATNSYKWVDYIAATGNGDCWSTASSTELWVTNNTKTADYIARLVFDAKGYAVLWCELNGIVGTPRYVYCVATGF